MAITIDTTSVDLHIPEFWSRKTVDETEHNLEFAQRFDRQFEKEAGARPYDQVNVATVSNFSVTSNITLGVAGTLSADTPANDPELDFNIAINTHAYKFFDMETEAQIMTDGNLLEKYAAKAAYAVAWKIDTDMAAFVDDWGSGTNGVIGTLGVALTDDDVIDALRQMNDAKVPQDGISFIMSSLQQAAFRKQEFFRNNDYAAAIGQIQKQTKGVFARIHNMDWVMSTNVEGSNSAGHDNAIFHREAVALCIIDNMRRKRFYEIDTDSDKFAVHAIYGALEVRGGAYTGTAGDMGGWGIWAKGL